MAPETVPVADGSGGPPDHGVGRADDRKDHVPRRAQRGARPAERAVAGHRGE